MALVGMKKLLKQAEAEGGAVGAFNVGDMEMVMGVVAAAEELKAPIILQIAERRLTASPLELMGPMMLSAAKCAGVDIAVHLDHGLTLETLRAALELGFTSVMFDGSALPLRENIRKVKEAGRLADAYGAAVEAELGVVGGSEGGAARGILCTDPDEAEFFCEETGADALAVAIGNAHGNYPALPELRFDVLAEIGKRLSVPLVLHGGTGMTERMFRKAIRLGIRKLNIATASFDALAGAARAYCGSCEKPDYFALSSAEVRGVYENVKRHIQIFRSAREECL